jgi:hypothetical protein
MLLQVEHVVDVYSLAMSTKFFEEREDQSEVKARIVAKYFNVWAKIIGPISRVQRIGYIDLFRYYGANATTRGRVVGIRESRIVAIPRNSQDSTTFSV